MTGRFNTEKMSSWWLKLKPALDNKLGEGKVRGWSISQGGSLILITKDAGTACDEHVQSMIREVMSSLMSSGMMEGAKVGIDQQYWKVVTDKVFTKAGEQVD